VEEDLTRTSTELANLTEAYDKMAGQYQSLLDARAVRAVRSIWTLRDRLRRLPSALAVAAKAVLRPLLPAGARRALRNAIGRPSPAARDTLSPEEIERFRSEIAASLGGIVAAHRDAPGFVVMPPGIGWDVELFQRPQQMALAFARLGYPVLYHLEAKYRDGLVGYRPRGDGIYVGYLPEGLEDLLTAVPQPIFLSYVYNYSWAKHLDRPVRVYEHIDHLDVFEHVYLRKDLDAWHREALAGAEVVAPSAVDLLAEVKEARPDAVLVPNGVDYDHFAEPATAAPDDLQQVLDGRPVVGYYGALAEWFDYDLLEAVARRLPDHHFVLIGPDYDGTAARSAAFHLPNVHWLGPRPYASLPGYLACFDVATVPFTVNEVTHAVSPLKLFEYMAGGKPVVTPPLRECARYRVVQIGDGPERFAEEIVRAVALGKDPGHVALLRRTARANTWEARVRAILEAVERRRAAPG
jgi:glycosyltransferase involved in cell wall biosynthesis